MNIKRVRRISSEIKKVISSSIINSLKDPRIDKLNVSVTEVKVTNDLRVLIPFQPLVCCVDHSRGKLTLGSDFIIN